MYHYVRAHRPSLSDGVRGLTAERFERQLDELTATAEPIDWARLRAWMGDHAALPDRALLLTFDDGLLDHAEVVLPILNRRSLHGVFFVPGCVLVEDRVLPAHQTHLLIGHLGRTSFEEVLLRELREAIPATDWLTHVDAEAAKRMYHYEPLPRARLKYLLTETLPIELRNAVLDRLFERHVGSASQWAGRWYLDREMIRRMQADGHTVGGHGFTHEPYLRLAPRQRDKDLRLSAAVLDEILGPSLRPMSFPYGSFDHDTCRAARRAGFAAAFTTQPQWITDACDAYRVPRFDTVSIQQNAGPVSRI